LIDVSLRLKIISRTTASPARPRDVVMAAESRDGKLRSGERQLARSTGARHGLVFDLFFLFIHHHDEHDWRRWLFFLSVAGASALSAPVSICACTALSISFIRYTWCDFVCSSHVAHVPALSRVNAAASFVFYFTKAT
jgi:hypothetical protein